MGIAENLVFAKCVVVESLQCEGGGNLEIWNILKTIFMNAENLVFAKCVVVESLLVPPPVTPISCKKFFFGTVFQSVRLRPSMARCWIWPPAAPQQAIHVRGN